MNRSIISNNQLSVISYPCKCSFNFPPTLISAKRATILCSFLASIRTMRNYQLYTTLLQPFSKIIRISSFVINQTFHSTTWATRSFAWYRNFFQCFLYQRDFCRGRRVQVVPQRNSLAVCHHHPLRTLSTFGLSDAEPPFLAGAKLPSANVSAHFSRPFSSSSARKDRQALTQTPLSSHSCNRRQHVDGDGYHGGKSFHRAPLRNTHKMPSKHCLFEILLRPFRLKYLGSSRNGAILAHCLLVNSLLNLFIVIRESSFVIADSLLSIYIRDKVFV